MDSSSEFCSSPLEAVTITGIDPNNPMIQIVIRFVRSRTLVRFVISPPTFRTFSSNVQVVKYVSFRHSNKKTKPERNPPLWVSRVLRAVENPKWNDWDSHLNIAKFNSNSLLGTHTQLVSRRPIIIMISRIILKLGIQKDTAQSWRCIRPIDTCAQCTCT